MEVIFLGVEILTWIWGVKLSGNNYMCFIGGAFV